jgi:2-keto-4-pentenoate hydratase
MLNHADLEATAARLRAAYTDGPVAPLRDLLEPADVDSAYGIQSLNTQHWLRQGRVIGGWKVGLTAKAVQQQMGVDHPDFGVLYADRQLPDGGELDLAPLFAPRGEAEIALVLSDDVTEPGLTAATVAQHIAYASPAIELVDSRIKDWRITFADTVADNGSASGYVLGAAKVSLDTLDLYACGMVLEEDGAVVSVGAGAASMGHPLNAAAWLANALLERGQKLQAGQVILTGALGPMVNLRPGQHLKATIGGLGAVSMRSAG